jgi:dihydrolipoamide dehydrogenase
MIEKFDVVVIGSGPGGYVAAIRAAQLGFKTACVEKKELGGTCLNVGCIPSKALLHSSEKYAECMQSARHGIYMENLRADFSVMMTRKNAIVSSFREGIGALFKKNRITHFAATASLLSSTRVALSPQKEEIEAKYIILASGSEPAQLPFLPFDEKRIVSSTGALSLGAVPKRLVVVGAGIIGVELGSVYKRLGSDVLFVEFMDRICPTLDASLSNELHAQLLKQGMRFHLSSKVTGAQMTQREISLTISHPDQTVTADVVLVSIGRRATTSALNLDRVGITLSSQGTIPINGSFQTTQPNIYAIGDCVDGVMLAHKAEEEGVAVAEIIAGQTPRICYAAIPNVVYTHPEVASVGLTDLQIEQFALEAKTGLFPFKINSRARCTGEESGFVKLYAEKNTGKILGVHIIGAHASELIAEGVLAIQKQLCLSDIIHTPHAHPTLCEAIKEAALDAEKRAIHK